MKRHLEFLGWWSTSNPRVSPPSTQDTPRCQHGGWDDQGWKWQNHDMQKGRWREIRVLQLEVHSQDFVTIHHTKEHTEWMLQNYSCKVSVLPQTTSLEQWTMTNRKEKNMFCGLSESNNSTALDSQLLKLRILFFFCQINRRFWDPSCERHPHHDWRPLWDLTSCSGRLPPAGHQAHHPGKGKKDAHNRPR